MRYVIDEKEGTAAPFLTMAPGPLKTVTSALAAKILASLAREPSYPARLAKELDVHEQKICYHIRKLEHAGILAVVEEEKIQGSLAKHYGLAAPVIGAVFGAMSPASRILKSDESEARYLSPFIKDGKFDALIVVGSPDPHGPFGARSRDGYLGADLGLFFGTRLLSTSAMHVRLDTEFRSDDWQQNLIVIGGPVVNKVTEQLNRHLPVAFDEKNNLVSRVTRKEYGADTTGVIEKIENPRRKGKQILLVSGRRYAGTRAAILALLTRFPAIVAGNAKDHRVFATVVEGFDRDSDGVVDAVEIRE